HGAGLAGQRAQPLSEPLPCDVARGNAGAHALERRRRGRDRAVTAPAGGKHRAAAHGSGPHLPDGDADVREGAELGGDAAVDVPEVAGRASWRALGCGATRPGPVRRLYSPCCWMRRYSALRLIPSCSAAACTLPP